jgi:hypothetical protein
MPTVTFHIPEEKKGVWQQFLDMIHGEKVGAGKVILPWIEQFVNNRWPGNAQSRMTQFLGLAHPPRERGIDQRVCPKCSRLMIYYPSDANLLCYECQPR